MAYEKQNFKDGQVLTAEQLNKMEDGIAKCPQAWVEYGEMVEILPETQAISTGDDSFALMDAINGVEVGGTYTVTYNGVAYECMAQLFAGDGAQLYVLGDATSYGLSGNNEPFLLAIVPDYLVETLGAAAQIFALDGATSVTIAISEQEVLVHKMDEKYLPEVIEFVYNTDGSVTCQYSPSEVWALLSESTVRDVSIYVASTRQFVKNATITPSPDFNSDNAYYIVFSVVNTVSMQQAHVGFMQIRCTENDFSVGSAV